MHKVQDYPSSAAWHYRGDGPSHTATADRRASDRTPTLAPCVYVVSEVLDDQEPHTHEGRGFVHNWGTGGMLVEVQGSVDFPRMLEVHLAGDRGSRVWLLEICWSRRVPSQTKESRWFMGGRLLFARCR